MGIIDEGLEIARFKKLKEKRGKGELTTLEAAELQLVERKIEKQAKGKD